MTKSAYDRWLKFISRPTSESGLTFPIAEAKAIMAIPLRRIEPDWRRTKREINKAAKRARTHGGQT
jgi:hypothetical protein